MDDVVKPQFISCLVGYSKLWKPTSVSLDVVAVDKMTSLVAEYCWGHLTASAYPKMADESVAWQKTNN